MDVTKFGFIALCGAPNAGKSTLFNALVGSEVAAVSRKPQTTRVQILSVLERGSSQMAFVDTPGLSSSPFLGEMLRKNALKALKTSDLIVVVIDLADHQTRNAHVLLEDLLSRYGQGPTIFLVAFNKIDKVSDFIALPKIAEFNKYTRVQDFVVLSAQKRKNVNALWSIIDKFLPQGPWFYPAKTDLRGNLHHWAAEMTREQVFHQFHQEIPYQVYVETQSIQEAEDGLHIFQTLVLAKPSQKPIVLGKQGQQLKILGQRSRLKIAKILKRRVHLYLHVKVCPQWMTRPQNLKDAGLQ